MLRNPQFDSSTKGSILADLAGDDEPLFKNFLLLVAEKDRAGELEEIAKEFERLMAREERRLTVELTTARELSDAESGAILKQIEEKLPKSTLLTVGGAATVPIPEITAIAAEDVSTEPAASAASTLPRECFTANFIDGVDFFISAYR